MITQARLRFRLTYDLLTGEFRYLINRGKMKAGQVAGTIREDGYVIIGIDGELYLAHRLVHLYLYGELPPADMDVDHIDGNPTNNRFWNLRVGTRSQNLHNSRLNKRSKCGFKGVRPTKKNRFQARIAVNKQQVYLGVFDTPGEAHAAYVKAAVEHYGEFARAA